MYELQLGPSIIRATSFSQKSGKKLELIHFKIRKNRILKIVLFFAHNWFITITEPLLSVHIVPSRLTQSSQALAAIIEAFPRTENPAWRSTWGECTRTQWFTNVHILIASTAQFTGHLIKDTVRDTVLTLRFVILSHALFLTAFTVLANVQPWN